MRYLLLVLALQVWTLRQDVPQDTPQVPPQLHWRAKMLDWKMGEFVKHHNTHVVKAWVEFNTALDDWSRIVVKHSQTLDLTNKSRHVEEIEAWGRVKRKFKEFEEAYADSMKKVGKLRKEF